MEEFRAYANDQAVQQLLFTNIKELTADENADNISERVLARAKELDEELCAKTEAGLLDREDAKNLKLAAQALYECGKQAQNVEQTKEWFRKREAERQEDIKKTGEHLTNSFAFMEETFGNREALTGSQEMVIFITELSGAYHSLKFVRETGNDAYYKYNQLLLLGDRKEELRALAEMLV